MNPLLVGRGDRGAGCGAMLLGVCVCVCRDHPLSPFVALLPDGAMLTVPQLTLV